MRRARQNWLRLVQENDIHIAPKSDDLICRYYVCKGFEFLRNIASLALDDFPITNPVLIRNQAFDAIADLISRHPDRQRHATVLGHKFRDEASFLATYPALSASEGDSEHYPYYSRTRAATQDDLEALKHKDGLVSAMVEHKVPADEAVSIVGIFESACDGTEFQEEILLRAIWGVFLSIENCSDTPLTLSHLHAECSALAGFNNYGEVETETRRLELPKAPLSPSTTAIIPVAALIPPLHPLEKQATWTLVSDLRTC